MTYHRYSERSIILAVGLIFRNGMTPSAAYVRFEKIFFLPKERFAKNDGFVEIADMALPSGFCYILIVRNIAAGNGGAV